MSFCLTGGEDHALAATFDADAALPDGWRAIGRVTEGSEVTVDGEEYEGPAGHTHFGQARTWVARMEHHVLVVITHSARARRDAKCLRARQRDADSESAAALMEGAGSGVVAGPGPRVGVGGPGPRVDVRFRFRRLEAWILRQLSSRRAARPHQHPPRTHSYSASRAMARTHFARARRRALCPRAMRSGASECGKAASVSGSELCRP